MIWISPGNVFAVNIGVMHSPVTLETEVPIVNFCELYDSHNIEDEEFSLKAT